MADVILIFPLTGPIDKVVTGLMLPLSVLQIATPLVKECFRVKIIDQRVSEDWKDVLSAELKNEEVLCVGISSMTGPQIIGGLDASKIVKDLSPDIPVVWGGVHPSLEPEQTIENELVDIVVIGDGELVFLEVVKALKEKKALDAIDNIYFKQKGGITKNDIKAMPELDKLPWPSYELVDVEKYGESAFQRGAGIAMVTSRGCPNRCAFCYNQKYASRRWRARSAESVVEHMKFLKEQFNIERIFLLDDEFFISRKRVAEICELLVGERVNLIIDNANITVRAILRYDRELLTLIKSAGIKHIFIGVESGSDEMLEYIQKDITIEMVYEANRKLKKAGITPIFSWMTGLPSESKNHTKETLTAMRNVILENEDATFYGLNIYSPYPGTKLYDICIKDGMKQPETLKEWATRDFLEPFIEKCDKSDRGFFIKAEMMARYMDPKVWQKTGGLIGFMKNAYSHFIRFRVKYNFYRFMPEIYLLRLLTQLKRNA